MRWVLRIFVAFEVIRLLAWLVFLSCIMFGNSPSLGRESETLILVTLGAFYLGFPYSWTISAFSGSWNFFQITPHLPVQLAMTHFVLWAGATGFMYRLLRYIQRRNFMKDPKMGS